MELSTHLKVSIAAWRCHSRDSGIGAPHGALMGPNPDTRLAMAASAAVYPQVHKWLAQRHHGLRVQAAGVSPCASCAGTIAMRSRLQK